MTCFVEVKKRSKTNILPRGYEALYHARLTKLAYEAASVLLLRSPKGGKHAAGLGQQLARAANLDGAACFEHHNMVAIDNAGQAMGYGDGSTGLGAQTVLDAGSRIGVEGGGRFIHQQHKRPTQQRARQA